VKTIREIGFKKSFNFLLFSFLQGIYFLLFLPQLRKIFLIIEGAKVGKDTTILGVKFFNYQHKGFGGLKIGDECFLGDETLIDLYDKVVLEDQVTLAQRVTVLTHLNVGFRNHPLQKFFPKMSKQTTFKKGCCVSAGSTVLPGVTVGECSMVAAGSVVIKDVEPFTLVAGVPARKIRDLR